MVVILKQFKLVTIDIFYYMPDYRHIVQEFLLQHIDEVPDIPKTYRFLNFWKNNICAVIQQIHISKSDLIDYKNINIIYDS